MFEKSFVLAKINLFKPKRKLYLCLVKAIPLLANNKSKKQHYGAQSRIKRKDRNHLICKF